MCEAKKCTDGRSLGREVVGSNLPPVPEVTLGGHSSGSLTIPRYKIGTRPWLEQSQLTLRIHYTQVTESGGNGASTLALKPTGESTKVRNREYQWLHKMVTLSPQKLKKKWTYGMNEWMDEELLFTMHPPPYGTQDLTGE